MRPAFLALTLAAAGCGAPPADPAKAEPPLGPLDAAELCAEYKRSPAEAAAKYEAGRPVTVRIRVVEVEQKGIAQVWLTHRDGGCRVVFSIPSDDVKAAADARGGPVTCTGLVTEVSDGIYLKGRVNQK